MRIVFNLLAVCFFLSSCSDGEAETFSGVIKHTAKAKDISSMCYSYTFMQSGTDKTFGVVMSARNDAMLEVFLEDDVSISGSFVRKERTFDKLEQRPVNADLTPKDVLCEFFEIETIDKVRKK